ncbi:MAG TPA: DUF692 family protein [Caldilineae bacterium]|nr:DUF692 family protein [Caldilineae bacterium]
MNFALNCSPQAAELVQTGQIQIDLFKCPAWPELITKALDIGPAYVHFPLRVGDGSGNAFNTEAGQPADWTWIEQILQQTGTRYVNLHLHPPRQTGVLPDDGYGPAATVETTTRLIRDVEALAKHFGAERITVENGYNLDRQPLRPAYFAEVISEVVEATSCGFLFDLSHARMASEILGVPVEEYVAKLPLHATRELHITGIQYTGDYWLERMQQEGVDPAMIANISGRIMDHLPLVDEDWEVMRWAAESIQQGIWNTPDIVALECGGYGPFWQATLDEKALAEQVPRLYDMFSV